MNLLFKPALGDNKKIPIFVLINLNAKTKSKVYLCFWRSYVRDR